MSITFYNILKNFIWSVRLKILCYDKHLLQAYTMTLRRERAIPHDGKKIVCATVHRTMIIHGILFLFTSSCFLESTNIIYKQDFTYSTAITLSDKISLIYTLKVNSKKSICNKSQSCTARTNNR